MIEIEEIAPGEGPSTRHGDTVDVHYTGAFPDGAKFDSSVQRGRPLTVTIGKTGLIAGFTLGLIGMKLGGRRRITIPYELGYGEEGRPPVIPPRSTLVFDIVIVRHVAKA
jgi:FKBP-type peptidyl-prolyl cis-trans isomerase